MTVGNRIKWALFPLILAGSAVNGGYALAPTARAEVATDLSAGRPAKPAAVFGRVASAPGAVRRGAHGVGIAGSRVEAINPVDGKTIASAIAGPDGGYRLTLEPGEYLLRGGGEKRYVHLEAGQELEVNLAWPNP